MPGGSLVCERAALLLHNHLGAGDVTVLIDNVGFQTALTSC